jgi:hypothetical protein
MSIFLNILQVLIIICMFVYWYKDPTMAGRIVERVTGTAKLIYSIPIVNFIVSRIIRGVRYLRSLFSNR